MNNTWFLRPCSRRLLESETGPILRPELHGYNPVLTLWHHKALCEGSAQHKPPCTPRRFQPELAGSSLLLRRGWLHILYQNTPTDLKYVGKWAKIKMPEPVKLQHVPTNENVNEEVPSSAGPQKENQNPQNLLFWLKKATKRAGYYLSTRHQKPREPHVQKTECGWALNRTEQKQQKPLIQIQKRLWKDHLLLWL